MDALVALRDGLAREPIDWASWLVYAASSARARSTSRRGVPSSWVASPSRCSSAAG